MADHSRATEAAAWAAAEGIATAEQRALLEADPAAWRLMLERLMDETEDHLDSVSGIEGPERAQVVSDLEAELDRLEAAYDLLLGANGGSEVLIPTADPSGEVRLQARGRTAPSWCGRVAPTWSPTATLTWPIASKPWAGRSSDGRCTATSPSPTA
jgi:hypothetical protein